MVQTKIDLKAASSTAKAYAQDVLGWTAARIEEIEREPYNGRDTWAITLSDSGTSVLGFALPSPYKRFFVDVETGEMLGFIIREVIRR
jgi:hypothetical protein